MQFQGEKFNVMVNYPLLISTKHIEGLRCNYSQRAEGKIKIKLKTDKEEREMKEKNDHPVT